MGYLGGRPRFLPKAAAARVISIEFANHLERHDAL